MRRRAMMELAAVRQERERAEGVETSAGFLTRAAGQNFAGERSVETYFVTGSDVVTSQCVQNNRLSAAFRYGIRIINNALLVYSHGTPVTNIRMVTAMANTRYHVVVTLKANNTITAYLNGVAKGSAIAAEAPSDGFTLGNFYDSSSRFYGKIFHARAFCHPLTASEVAKLYNGGKPAEYVTPKWMKRQTQLYTLDLSTSLRYGGATYSEGALHYTNANSTHAVLWAWGSVAVLPAEISGEHAVGYFEIEVAYATNYDVVVKWGFAANSGSINIPSLDVVMPKALNSIKFRIPTTDSDVLGKPWYGLAKYLNAWIYRSGNNSIPAGDLDLTITAVAVRSVGCVAEYLPQNLLSTRKRDFPQVVFPVDRYTPSSYVFSSNVGTVTRNLFNQPQANGFSGDFMRFEAITQISLYCHYWYRQIAKFAPIRITFEYRSNIAIYASQTSESPTAADTVIVAEPNEGVPLIATVECGFGVVAYLSSASSTTAWLEMRVLSIDVIEGVAQAWLDSSKQLPANDEYLPPLFQGIGGYDLTATGSPKVITK